MLMWPFLGGLVSGAMSLFGGSQTADAQKEANAANLAFARENAAQQKEMAEKNIALQKEFAQSGLQWKAQDAKAAGIHPIYAMGAAGSSFSPVSIAGSSLSQSPVTGMGDAIQRAGQDFGRAVTATQPKDKQVEQVLATQTALTTQRMGLENELLAAQIAKAKQALVSPGIPSLGQRYGIEGQGETVGGSPTPNAIVNERFGSWPKTTWEEENKRVSRAPGAPSQEAFSIADVGYSNTIGGGYSAIPSKDVKERIEDNIVQEVLWAVRNNLLPSMGINENPPKVPVPKGYDSWRYHPFYQEYRPHKKGWFGIHY